MMRLVSIMLVAGITACTTAPEADPADAAEVSSFAANQSEPLLALADHLLGNYFASDVTRPPTICISMHDGRSEVALEQDGELALMTRYSSLAPFARCGLVDGAWQDVETGDPAIVFNIHSFTCADDANCSGFGSYISGTASSMSSRYAMAYAGGAWQFTRNDWLVGED